MTDLQISPQPDKLDQCIIQACISHSVSPVKQNLLVIINKNPQITTKNKYMQLVSNVPVLKILFLKELQVYKLFA